MLSDDGKTSCLSLITNDILKDVESSYKKEGKLTDWSLLTLHNVFGAPFERATEMLEKDCVTVLTNPRRTRTVIQVHGSTGELYSLFPDVNFCNCPAYQYQVLKDNTRLTCKHVLAAKLAMIMGKVRLIELSDKELVQVLCSAANCDNSADTTLI